MTCCVSVDTVGRCLDIALCYVEHLDDMLGILLLVDVLI